MYGLERRDIVPAFGNACKCQFRVSSRRSEGSNTAEQTQSVLPCRPGIFPITRARESISATCGEGQAFLQIFYPACKNKEPPGEGSLWMKYALGHR